MSERSRAAERLREGPRPAGRIERDGATVRARLGATATYLLDQLEHAKGLLRQESQRLAEEARQLRDVAAADNAEADALEALGTKARAGAQALRDRAKGAADRALALATASADALAKGDKLLTEAWAVIGKDLGVEIPPRARACRSGGYEVLEWEP